MKLITTLFLLFISIVSYSQNYSVSTTASYSLDKTSVGISAIMEERLATAQSHLMFYSNGDIELIMKLGLTLSKQTKSRFVVYPAYLKYDVKKQKYITPIGLSCISTFGDLTTNIGIDIFKKKNNETNKVEYFFLNASVNYTLFGSRYK